MNAILGELMGKAYLAVYLLCFYGLLSNVDIVYNRIKARVKQSDMFERYIHRNV